MTPTTERTGPKKAGSGTIATTLRFGPHFTEKSPTLRRNRWRNRTHLTRIAKRVTDLEKRIEQLENTFETHLANHSEGDR